MLQSDGLLALGEVETGTLVVYFITTNQKDFPVKIGRSNTLSLPRRMSQLQIAMPFALKVLYVSEADAHLEREIHDALSKDRMRGEWFARSPAVEQWIRSLVKDDPQWRLRFGFSESQTIKV